jgi:hypothetical protein
LSYVRDIDSKMNEEEYEDVIYCENDSDVEREDNRVVLDSLKVYGIYRRETNMIVYVGRTKRNLEIRFREHQLSSQYVNSYIMNNGGFDKYGIELLEECNNVRDFIDWESHLILEMEPICNINGKYKEKTVKDGTVKKNWALIGAIKRKYKKNR